MSRSAGTIFRPACLALLLSVVSGMANNYDALWLYKTKISFPGYNKSEILTNFPVLVQLGTNISNFAYDQFSSPTNAADLRFFTSDFSTQLDYEVELWDTNLDLTTISPTSIPYCILWLKADAGVQTNTTNGVTGWTDLSLSGNGAAAPAGHEPTYVTNVVNGRPVISFDGVAGCLTNSSWTPGFNSSAALTFFFVSQIKSLSNAVGFFAQRTLTANDYNDNGALSIEQTGTTPRGVRYYRNNNPLIDVVRDNSKFRIDVLRVDGTGAQTWLDGLPSGTSGVSFASALAPVEYAIGARDGTGGVSGFGQVDFAEIIMYRSALTSTQLWQVGTYLSEKYGLNTAYKRPGQSYLWVRIPALTTNTSVWAYWGSQTPTNPPVSTTNGTVWNSNYKAVWHMGETNAHDWTANTNNGTSYTNVNVTGFIGQGQSFAGNTYIDLGNRPSLNITNSLTVSSWLYHNTGIGWSFMYSAGNGGSWYVDFGLNDSNQWGGEIALPNNRITGPPSQQEAKIWHHQVIVYDYGAGKVLLYHDGILVSSTNDTGSIPSANAFKIGCKYDLSNFWNSMVDELRVSSAAESSNWIWACWLSQASNSFFNSYGIMEKTKKGTIMRIQ